MLIILDPATHGGAYPAGGPRADDDDWKDAANHASQHAGDSGNADLFSNLLGALGQKKQRLAEEDVDEDGQCYPLPPPPSYIYSRTKYDRHMQRRKREVAQGLE